MRRTVLSFLLIQLIVLTFAAPPASAGTWYEPGRKRLTIGGSLVDALADFQRHGGQVDEIMTTEDLAGKPPLTYGIQNGRAVFAIGGGQGGELAGLVTVDGSSIEASLTPDGFLRLRPDQTGVKNRNMELYRALFPDQDLSQYTTEAIFEYIDESGKRFLFGGSEDGKTTAFLFKKDPNTGELVYKVERDIARAKEAKTGSWVGVDESATFPVRLKICDENRDNCVIRNIVKKPGDEIRINPTTQAIKITFNKDILPYREKFGNAQRLNWACEYKGEGFYFTYREGFMGGDARRLPNRIGTLTCDKNELCCERTGPGQKCNFDYRDYLDDPPNMFLFALNWLTTRLDHHKQHFTLTLDPNLKDHLRITEFENVNCVKTANSLDRTYAGNDVPSPIFESLKSSLCPDIGGGCSGEPSFSALEVTGVGHGVTLIDERTGVKLNNVTLAKIFVLRNDYGTAKRGDFVGAVVDNRNGKSVISTLLNMEDQPRAPDLLDKKDHIQPDNVQAILAEIEKEKQAEEIQRQELTDRQRVLVVFPARHGWGFAQQPQGARQIAGGRQPAHIVALPPAEEEPRRFAAASSLPRSERTQADRYGGQDPRWQSGTGRTDYYGSPTYQRSPAPAAPPQQYYSPRSAPAYGMSPSYAPESQGSMQSQALQPPERVQEPPQYASPSARFYRTAAAELAARRAAEERASYSASRPQVPLRVPIQQDVEEQRLPSVQRTSLQTMPEEPVSSRDLQSPAARALPQEPPPEMRYAAPQPPLPMVREVAEEPEPMETTRETTTVAQEAKFEERAVERPTHVEKPVLLTPSLIREVQKRLKRQGYLISNVDGTLGQETSRAIWQFQQDVTLHPTGRIDRRLLTSLGIEADNGWSAPSPTVTSRAFTTPKSEPWKPSRDQVIEVQKRLALIGYRPGPPDGLFGGQTAEAVKQFQRRAGLRATGHIDQEVLRRLSIAQ